MVQIMSFYMTLEYLIRTSYYKLKDLNLFQEKLKDLN